MNWDIITWVVIGFIAALLAAALWLTGKARDAIDRMADLDGEECPVQATRPGESEWDGMIRDHGDPSDISTSGDEFAMPEAK